MASGAYLSIRREEERDYDLIDEIETAAFGEPGEAQLVRSLRNAATPNLSLVAILRDELVGHAFLSPVTIEDAPTAPACAGLAPLAVRPDVQGEGIGDALVRAALDACSSLGWEAVFLLGDPSYYVRFGFTLSAPRGLRYESEAYDPGFQVLEIVPGALESCRGWVRYHRAFDDL